MEEVDRDDMSMAVYDKLLEGNAGEMERKQIMLRKARLHKRKGNFAEAVSLWQEALRSGGFSAEPYVELAKVYEHRFADMGKARDYTERALEQVTLVQALRPQRLSPYLEENLLERLRRIKQKQRKQGMSGA
jgi:tetratricopeptide (TPR) repeat protein